MSKFEPIKLNQINRIIDDDDGWTKRVKCTIRVASSESPNSLARMANKHAISLYNNQLDNDNNRIALLGIANRIDTNAELTDKAELLAYGARSC